MINYGRQFIDDEEFLLVTSHRRENILNKNSLKNIVDLINSSEKKVLFEFLLLGFIFYGLLIGTISFNGFLSYLFASSYLLFFIFSFLRYRKLEPLS